MREVRRRICEDSSWPATELSQLSQVTIPDVLTHAHPVKLSCAAPPARTQHSACHSSSLTNELRPRNGATHFCSKTWPFLQEMGCAAPCRAHAAPPPAAPGRRKWVAPVPQAQRILARDRVLRQESGYQAHRSSPWRTPRSLARFLRKTSFLREPRYTFGVIIRHRAKPRSQCSARNIVSAVGVRYRDVGEGNRFGGILRFSYHDAASGRPLRQHQNLA
jgi:hypothetical protein